MSRKIAGFALSSLDCFYFLFVLAALLPAVCQAKEFEYIDQGPAQGTCLNQNQKEGLNPGYLGECGDLRGMNLSGKILNGISLRGADLSNANLSDSTLNNVDFEHANLSEALITRGHFSKVNFKFARLVRLNAEHSVFHSCSFESANLSRSKLNDSYFQYSLFTATRMVGVEAMNANFAEIDGAGMMAVASTFKSASFVSAALNNANFTGSDLSESDFSNVKSRGITLDEVICNKTNFTKSTFVYFNMNNSTCTSASFDHCSWSAGSMFNTRIFESSGSSAYLGESTLINSTFLNTTSKPEANDTWNLPRNDFRNANLNVVGMQAEQFYKSIFGSGTAQPFSADDLLKGKVMLTTSTVNVKMLNTQNDDDGSWNIHPREALKNIIKVHETVTSAAEIKDQLADAEVYIIPLILSYNSGIFESPEVTDLLKKFLTKPNKRLILLGPSPYFLKALAGKHFKSPKFYACDEYGENMEMKLDPQLAKARFLAGLTDVTTNAHCMFDPFRWSALPVGTEVLYGNSAQDAAFVFRLPYGQSEIWSVSFTYGNAGFMGDEQKNSFYKILRALALARP